MKAYQVIYEDEFSNLCNLGFYKSLDDAVDDINECIIDDMFKIKKGELKEYPSTLGSAFDCSIYDLALDRGEVPLEELDKNYTAEFVRGFVFDTDFFKDEIDKL